MLSQRTIASLLEHTWQATQIQRTLKRSTGCRKPLRARYVSFSFAKSNVLLPIYNELRRVYFVAGRHWSRGWCLTVETRHMIWIMKSWRWSMSRRPRKRYAESLLVLAMCILVCKGRDEFLAAASSRPAKIVHIFAEFDCVFCSVELY